MTFCPAFGAPGIPACARAGQGAVPVQTVPSVLYCAHPIPFFSWGTDVGYGWTDRVLSLDIGVLWKGAETPAFPGMPSPGSSPRHTPPARAVALPGVTPRRPRMVRVLGTGPKPAFPDLLRACSNTFSSLVFSHCTSCSMIPNKPLALPRLGLLRREPIRMRRGVVHHLREDHRPRRRQRSPCPPQMQVLGCPCRIDFSRTLAALIASSGGRLR